MSDEVELTQMSCAKCGVAVDVSVAKAKALIAKGEEPLCLEDYVEAHPEQFE